MKKLSLLFFLLVAASVVAYQFKPVKHIANAVIVSINYINEEGTTISERVIIPEGYNRVEYPEGSFEEYLRNYKLKKYGSKIINYDDSEYYWQQGHIGVLDIPVPKNGLQQCADALIRIRSEYLWESNRKDEIGFNFTSGDYCS